jgi:hypothetical protein
MGVLATRAVRAFVISDTVTVFKNGALVSFTTDGGRAPESTLELTDTLTPFFHTLETINTSESVTVPTVTRIITDTPAAPKETLYVLPYSETVAPSPVPPTITETVFIDVAALSNLLIIVPSETLHWTASAPGITDTVTMVPLNSYQPTFSDTIHLSPTIVITETVSTLLT